jgi:hypothetical protein
VIEKRRSRVSALIFGLLVLHQTVSASTSCFRGSDANDPRQVNLLVSIVFNYSNFKTADGHQVGFDRIPDREDIKNITEIGTLFFYGAKHYPFRNLLPPRSLDDESVNTTDEMVRVKQEFLSTLKSAMGNQVSDRKMVIFSGHGTGCVDPATNVQHWCLLLPVYVALASIKHDDADAHKLLYSTTDPWVVSDEDLYAATGATYFLIDSCYAQLMTPMVERLIASGKHIVFLHAGAGNIPASASPEGGTLITAMAQLLHRIHSIVEADRVVRADDESLAFLDWQGLGEMSFREALAIMQVNTLNSKEFKEPLRPIQAIFDDPSAQARYFSKTMDDMTGRLLASGIVDDTCFQQLHDEVKPGSPAGGAHPIRPTWEQLATLINNPDRVGFLMSTEDLGFRTLYPGSDLTVEQAHSAFGYLKDWIGTQHAAEFACSIHLANADCAHTQPLAESRL